jgi:hydrogenase nickel incorporation protein HypA/HybF
MHERSLVKNLLDQVRFIIDENEAEFAEEVLVEIGPLAGVEFNLVKSAFDQLVRESGQRVGRLSTQQVPLIVRCRVCGVESELDDFVFRCRA